MKKITPLTKTQKEYLSQVLHDELSELKPELSVVSVTEKVDEIVFNVAKSLVMAAGMEQARDNDFRGRLLAKKDRLILSIKQL